jgi:hypothetical protein
MTTQALRLRHSNAATIQRSAAAHAARPFLFNPVIGQKAAMPTPAARTIIGVGKTACESSGGRGAWLSDFACPTLVHSRSSRNGLPSAANAAQLIDSCDHAVLPAERAASVMMRSLALQSPTRRSAPAMLSLSQ